MAEPQSPADPTKPTDYGSVAEQVARALVANLPQGQAAQWLSGVRIESDYNVIAASLKLASDVAVRFAQSLADAEAGNDAAFGRLAATAVNDLLGVNVNASAFRGRGQRGARVGEMDQVTRALLGVFGGSQTALEPSDAPAQKFMGTMLSFAIEGWLEGWIFEMLSAACPLLGDIETFGELDDILAQVMGFGRLSRRVLSPLIDATVVTPMEWKVNKTYTPRLLTASECARQIARGRMSREQAVEELARQGYSDERIDALLTSATKGHTIADLDLLIRSGQWNEGSAVAHLGDQGYNPAVAETELRLERLKRIASFERAIATLAVDAFGDGRIDEGTLGGFVTGATISPQEKAQLTELAHARRILTRRPLTSGEARAAVLKKVLSFRDYRLALERDGRDDEAIAVLELLLRAEVDDRRDIEEHRREQERERAAEQAESARVAAEKKAAAEKLRDQQRRGTEADLERAAIRGLIPIARVAEVYAFHYDPDTVGILVAQLTDDRLAYVAQLQAREDAAKRIPVTRATLGDLEDAYLRNIITLGDYRTRLAQLHVDAGDADVLAATLEARKRDADFAAAKRAQADEAAKVKHVNLGIVEQLVRRGHRTIAEYDRTLADLGFDEAARAAMGELLQLQITDDTRAREARAATIAASRVKGLTLEQLRRAVVLSVEPVATFEAWLVQNGYTADAQRVLLAELRADVDEAEAARQRRADAERRRVEPVIPLSDVARAARLGLVPVQVYVDRLRRDGYSADDIDIEIDLLVAEMTELAAAREKRELAEAAARAKGLSLADTARAVKAGLLPIDNYTAAAITAGSTKAAADVLTQLLAGEVAALVAARRRRDAIAAREPEKDLSIAQLEAAVLGDKVDVDEYVAQLRAMGYDADEAGLLAALLVDKLEAKAAKSEGDGA